jgi:amidase
MSDQLINSQVTELAKAIRDGQASSSEVVSSYLRRIEEVNPRLNAVVNLAADSALAQAELADAATVSGEILGPLHGVPMTLKDSLDTKDMVTTGGTRGRASFTPTEDATVATRLRVAGAILLGKTNTPEFTSSFETDNLVMGVPPIRMI